MDAHVGSVVGEIHDGGGGACAAYFAVFVDWAAVLIIGASQNAEWG